MEHEEDKLAIPEVFYNHSTGTKFDRCIDCNAFLLDGKSEYFIEKAIKTYEGFTARDIIFEYAICQACAEKVRKQMSKESMQSIEHYFAEKVNLAERMQLVGNNPDNPSVWMDQCLVKGTSIDNLTEYQIYAQCKGDQLVTTQMPYMISAAALDEISQLLSNKTLDELDGFMNKHFGPSPDLMEPLPHRRKVVLL